MKYSNCFNYLVLIVFFISELNGTTTLSQERTEPIIVDHTCTDLFKIPAEWINQSKSDFRIWYGHTSHGSQPVSGMEVIQTQYGSPYTFNPSGYGGALSLQETGGDLGHNGDLGWESDTRHQLDQVGNDRNVVIWSWCGGVSDNSEWGINTYLNAMNQLEIDYPDVTFIYMTGHLDGTGESGNLHIRNEQIRNYCFDNNKVLFDFADIESYDPDGNYFLGRNANDNCDYNEGNWAVEWCAANPGSELCSYCDCAHSQSLNCNLKGRAFWWMLARLAGWEGLQSPDFGYRVIPTTLSFGNVVIQSSAAKTIHISNNGLNAVIINNLACDNSAFSFDNSGFSLDVGDSRDVEVTFTPTTAQTYTGTLTIYSSQAGNSDVTLSGTGTRGAAIPGRIEAEDYIAMQGIQTESTEDVGGGLNVGWIDTGDWMDYIVNVQATGTYRLSYRIASESESGQIELQSSGTTIATTNLPVTGGWQSWQTISTTVNLTQGIQTLRVYSSIGGWNLNWFEFISDSGPSNTPTEIDAFHRSGQTFLTWRERRDVSNEFYHVYRHTKEITESNLNAAELVTVIPIPEGSAMYLTERWKVDWEWTPIQQNFIINDLGPELDDDQGLFVYTTQQNETGTAYYAVTSIVAGAEDRTINAGVNSLFTSVTETVTDPLPIVVWEAESRFARVYTQFMDYKNWNPTYTGYAYNYFVSLHDGYDPNISYPLYLHLEGHGTRYSFGDSSGTPWDWPAIQIWADDPHQSWYYGFSESHIYGDNWPQYIYGDLTIPNSGQISNFTELRILRAIHDVILNPRYNVDTNRIYAYGNSMGASGALTLALRYPDVFAAVGCCEPMTNYGESILWLPDVAPKWGTVADNLPIVNEGPYAAHLTKYNGQGVYDWMNHQQNMRERQGDEMAYISTLHGTLDDVIAWEFQGQPWIELMNTEARRGWIGAAPAVDHDWHGFPETHNFRLFEYFNFRKDRSFPAFTNFSLNPIKNSYYNVGLEWSCPWNDFAGDIVDTRGQYEIILRLYDDEYTFGTIPNAATVDITPRRLQQFSITPDKEYIWKNEQLPGNTVIQSGIVPADEYGLITITNFTVTKDGNRLSISPDGNPVDVNEYGVPDRFILAQNYPNPFNPTTFIQYSIPKNDYVELVISNIQGQMVRTLVSEEESAGIYTLKWDGRDEQGLKVPSGVYFYCFKTASGIMEMRKMLLLK